MRRHALSIRALLSGIGVALLALVSLLPSQFDATTAASPLLQADEPTPTVNAALSLDLRVDDDDKFGDPGAAVTYNFRVTNDDSTNGCGSAIEFFVENNTFNATPDQGTLNVGRGREGDFAITIRVPPDAEPGEADDATVRVECENDAAKADAVSILTTVTAGGRTVTPTPPVTRTPGATNTPSICGDDFEPDGSMASASEILPDVAQGRAICPSGDEDWASFGGIAGKIHTVDVPVMAAGLDLSLAIYDSSGNLLAFNDDFPRENAADIKPRIQSFRVPANGEYFIRVRDNAGRGGTNLTYNLILMSESFGPTPTLVQELCTDLFEPDGVPEQARLIVIREVQPNHRLCPSGDADWVRFFAKAGSRYALRVDSQSLAGADPLIVLTDRDGVSILDFSDDSGGTLDPRIEFSPFVDGFYFAQIKNVGDIGNQFITYSFFFEPLGVAGPPSPDLPPDEPPPGPEPTEEPLPTEEPTDALPPPGATPGVPTGTPTPRPTDVPYPSSASRNSIEGPKGQPPFVNGSYRGFIDPAFHRVWARNDQPVASAQAHRSWMWGPTGLSGRAEMYAQSDGGVRQVQYFDKARMEITDWQRDRANPWFVTNGLLVREMIQGQLQTGDDTFLERTPAQIGIAGDPDDREAPTYASFARLLERTEDRVGATATLLLRRDGSTTSTAARPEAQLAQYVPETGHHVAKVFWDFLQTRGPIDDGAREATLVDWVFAMGYPLTEPYWARVKIGGVEQEVLVQAFQRRVLTYTPGNPAGWQVEMGNVGRHYYWWRYGKQP